MEIKEPISRYYFWDYIPGSGWRQMGRTDGYETLKELKRHQLLNITKDMRASSYDWKILKATVLKRK